MEQGSSATAAAAGPHRPSRRRRQWIVTVMVVFAAVAVAGLLRRETPDVRLLRALERHDMPAADLALREGANPNAVVERCWPSHQWSDHLSSLVYRLMDRRDSWGMPLLYAVVCRRDSPAVRILLAHGAEANIKLSDGTTPLQIAKNVRDSWIVQMLGQAMSRQR